MATDYVKKINGKSIAASEVVPSSSLETKLDGIASVATKVESSSTNGSIKINGTDTTVYTHPTQTAYSAKGSATKVPKITTDSTGHVTSIEEVTISGVAPASHSHGNIANGGTLTDTAAAAAGNDYVVIRDADNAKIQTSTIKGTDVADAVSKKHSHSTLTLSTTAQAYDGTHTLALPSSDPYTSARTPASHTHGNIQNGGTLQTNDITIASGDKLVVTDSSDSNKIARTSLSFDGSTATKALTQKGTFEAFAKASDISTAIGNLDSEKTSTDGTNVQVKVTEADGKISGVSITTDTTANRNDGVYYVVGTTDYPAWVANHAYAVNDNAISGGKAYYCKTAHTSGSSFDSSKWTAIVTPVIKGTVTGVTALYSGMKIALKWPITGGSSSTYLNINSLGNVYIRRNDENMTGHLPANSVSFLAYDGTYWRWADYDSNTNNWVTTMGAYCDTAAGTQAKVATSTSTVYTAGESFLIRIVNANTYNGKITLNINSQGAKDVWINGAVSSSSNKTLPAGEHWCYYDGSVFHIWTDGTAQFTKLKAGTFTGNVTGNVTGNASTATDLASNSILSVGKGGTGKSSVTANSFLVGNGTSALVEKTPTEVRTLIGAGTSSLTLGNGASNAYYGDKGKTAYDHSQSTHAPTTSKSEASGGTETSLVTTGEKYTWNHKQSALPTSGTPSTTYAINVSGNADSVTNYSPGKRTYIWGQAVGTDKVLDISVGKNSFDTTFIIMFSTSSTKWPSIIAISCRYSNNAWESVPKASLIYNTNAGSNTAKPLIKQYIYDGSGHILLQPIVSRTSETQCTIIAASGDVSKLTISAIAETNSLWTNASEITNIEQNVSKDSVGSKIGDTNRPVYVSANGFVSQCDFAGSFLMSNNSADTLARRLTHKAEGFVDGVPVTLSIRLNETGTASNTLYFS